MSSSIKSMATMTRTALNPNAAEFVPLALRVAPASSNIADKIKPKSLETSGKPIRGRSDSTTSGTSDDESRQYWQFQLPDDITPDFDISEEDGLLGAERFASRGPSAVDYVNASKSFATQSVTENGRVNSFHFNRRQRQSSLHDMPLSYASCNSKFVFPEHGEGGSCGGIASLSSPSAWEHHSVACDQQMIQIGDGQHISDGSDVGFLSELVEEPLPDDGEMDPVELLAVEFPGFAAESLADIFHANGSDLSLTIEMLTQLELQDDAGPPRNAIIQTSSAPNLSMMDLPGFPSSEMVLHHTGDEFHQAVNIHRTGVGEDSFFSRPKVSADSRTPVDFAAAVRKSAAHHSGQWQYERNGSMNISVGTSGSSQVPAGSFAGDGRESDGDRLHFYDAAGHTHQLSPQLWLDTGESVANTYSDLREEARDHAHARNAYFEQARQAYFIGNKALTKELSGKGQWHNGQMKAAHNRAGESIFRQRNLATAHLLNNSQEQLRLIDLHGLHVSEAIHVLKQELAMLRSSARSTCQWLHVFICVGTGHHTKGSCMPARLPIAVERYLVEDEHLDYTEPEPGMLQVVIY